MDEAAKGATALGSGDVAAAVTHYSNAIDAKKRAVNYYIQRSTAYTRLSPADHSAALGDAEIGLVLAKDRQKKELIAEAQTTTRDLVVPSWPICRRTAVFNMV